MLTTFTSLKVKTKTVIAITVVAVAALGLAAGAAYLRYKPPAKTCVGGPKALQGKPCVKNLDCLGGQCLYGTPVKSMVPTAPAKTGGKWPFFN